MLVERLSKVWLAIIALALAGGIPCLAQRREEHPPHPAQRPHPQQKQNQAHHAGEWLRKYKNLPPEQQQRALDNDHAFHSLPPQQQQRLRQRLQHFSSRPPEEQERILNRMETWEHLTPPQKQDVRQLHEQMQQLPPQRREAVQNAIKALRAMPPEAREGQINSDAYKKEFSSDERNMLNRASKLPLAPAEPNEEEQGPEE